MLNPKTNQRELCYVVIIDNITPLKGYDRVELAHIAGWTVVVGKNQFQPGNAAIYFEIDSKLPEKEPFSNIDFLVKKKFKVKTQKMCGAYSQGLLMSAEDFGWHIVPKCEPLYSTPYIVDNEYHDHHVENESRFLTAALGVTYAETSDNQRKAAAADKYKKMAQRHGKLFRHQPFRWLMRRTWGKKLLFIFFGKKRDKKSSWPSWVTKTDEERVQNMPWILNDKDFWIATEKIDGSSTTFTIKRKSFNNYDFFVCSRNVCFDKPDKKCYYETNIYTEMAEKYRIEEKMKNMLFKDDRFADCEWITIQGETYGAGVQKRDYSTKEHGFMAFNFIDSKRGRWNSIDMKSYLEYSNGIPCVPILKKDYILPDTVEELLEYATGESKLDSGMREGIVFRSHDGTRSFKAVSNEYLVKYHG